MSGVDSDESVVDRDDHTISMSDDDEFYTGDILTEDERDDMLSKNCRPSPYQAYACICTSLAILIDGAVYVRCTNVAVAENSVDSAFPVVTAIIIEAVGFVYLLVPIADIASGRTRKNTASSHCLKSSYQYSLASLTSWHIIQRIGGLLSSRGIGFCN